MFIDSHCHLNFEDFSTDLEPTITRARAEGIDTFLTICTKLEEAGDILAVAEKYPYVFASVGVHPHDSGPTLEKFGAEGIRETLMRFCEEKKIVALGETGLDYYYDNSDRESQKDCFRLHLQVALEKNLPLSIHTRDAEEDTIKILKEFPGVRGVIHCFTGTPWLAEEALNLGFYISVSGIVTFKKAESIQETIRKLPIHKLLLETDAPFLAPTPLRGKRNEPAFMKHTAEFVAHLKNMSLEELGKRTTENFYMLFNKAVRSGDPRNAI